jgi:hypothetical protein
MRERLNGSPVTQAVAIGLLAIVVAFMLFTRVLNRGGDEAATAAAPAPATSAEATAVTPAPAVDPAATATPPSAAPVVPVASNEFVAGPGLPKPVVNAYDDGKTVVLLVIREHPQGCFSSASAGADCGGIDDQKLAAIVQALQGRANTEVFVTHAHGLFRYSRIAQGVEINRVPALIALQPKPLADGPLPAASISYGFRGPQSVLQVVADIEYTGPENLPYYPR